MPGPRQPTDLVKGKGLKHLSKAEEAQRRSGEVSVARPKTAKPPKWLPAALRKDFRSLGKRLIGAGLYTDLDGDTLGRYLVAQHQWLMATQQAERALSARDPDTGLPAPDLEGADNWGRVQERYFKQARNCANDMGLTVSSRCRLVLPPSAAQQKGEEDNPFLYLIQGGAQGHG